MAKNDFMQRIYSRFTFVFCLWVTGLSQAQTLVDFESGHTPPALSPTGVVITNNPDTQGNTSAQVLYFSKPSGNWKAVYLDFSSLIAVKQNDVLSFKLRSSVLGRVYVKVVKNGTTLVENWAPSYNSQPTPQTWTTCTLDIGALKNLDFNRIEINAAVDNLNTADIYIDDIKLYNQLSPNGEPVIQVNTSSNVITLGESLSWDASASFDPDGSITGYTWSLGDGTSATTPVVDHTYAEDGVFPVSLTVQDNEGKTTTWKSLVYVLPASARISALHWLTPSPQVYDKIEGAFLLKDTYSNVYDPDIVAVDAAITQPDGKVLKVPCFYYEKADYRPATDTWQKDANIHYWLLRFSATQTGTHQVALTLTDANGKVSGAIHTINVAAGSRKGYVKADASNRQFYRHTTGEPFYPLGINVAWGSTSQYATIINNLGAQGANYVRYWLVPFDRQGLEWKNGSGFYKGLGVYSQEAAAEQDSVLELCASQHVYLQMTLFQHGMFSENVNSNWSDNPYNSANGGPLTRAEQYFYNATAKQYTRKLLRYIVARWGYSPNLFAWELFNEVNFTGVYPNQSASWYPGVLAWHDEMGQYIKSLDAFQHPITTSSDATHLADMDKLQGLDGVQYHLYQTGLLQGQLTKDQTLLAQMTRTSLVNGEYGEDVTTADVPYDIQRVSIWTGIFSQVPHIMWKWDNYVNTSWASLFRVPAQYLSGEDIAAAGTQSSWSATATYNSSNLNMVGLKSGPHYYGVIYDASNRANLTGVTLNVSALPTGLYQLDVYDGVTGAVVSRSLPVYPQKSTVVLPVFSNMAAIKIKYVSALTKPVAYAGEDQTVSDGSTVSLTGTGSFNPSAGSLQYQWSLFSKPVSSVATLSTTHTVTTSFAADVPGTYTVVLQVSTGGMEDADTVTIWVNARPKAIAGDDVTVQTGATVTLDGSKSSDAEQDPLSYLWTIQSAPTGSRRQIINTTTAKPSLKVDLPGQYVLRLVVKDLTGESDPDDVVITADGVTDVEAATAASAVVYPNPTRGSIWLQWGGTAQRQTNVSLVDAHGQEVFAQLLTCTQQEGNNIVQVHVALSEGVYWLRWTTPEGTLTQKLVLGPETAVR